MKYLLALVLLVNYYTAFSQPKLEQATINTLDLFTSYVNDRSDKIRLLQLDLELLNRNANLFLDKQSSTPLTSSNLLVFTELGQVEERYSACIEASQYLDAEIRGECNLLLGKYKNICDELAGIRKELVNYLDKGNYKQEPKMDFFYTRIKRCEVLFYDLKILQTKLRWNLRDALAIYDIPQAKGPKAILAEHLHNLGLTAKDLFRGLYDNRPLDLNQTSQKMALIVQQMEADRNTWSGQLNATQLQAVSDIKQQVELMRGVVQTLNAKPNIPAEFTLYGPNYYFHNEQMLTLFNQPKIGLAARINALNKSLEVPKLALMYEVPIFKRQMPKILTEEEPPLPDPEQLMAIIKQRQDSVARAQAALPPKPSLDGFATNNLVFLLDVSASMTDPEKLPLLKKSMAYLLGLMRVEDNITIITYSGKAEMIMAPTSAKYKQKILQTIDSIQVKGRSDIGAGLALAYNTTQQNFIQGGNNRIILATDGKFELEASDYRRIKQSAKDGIALSVFYFNKREDAETAKILQKVANSGNGAYRYITPDKAEELLLKEAQAVRRD